MSDACASIGGVPVGAYQAADVAYWLVVVQAIFAGISGLAAAVSAGAAVYVIRATVTQSREARGARERDLVREQLRRLVDGLDAIRDVLNADHADETDFDIARARLAAAVALKPIDLPACEAVLAHDMPKPPYAMGNLEPRRRLDAALDEIRSYSRRLATSD